MFGKNEIVGRKMFADPDTAGKLLVTSIFYTLQGEGPYAGRHCVFVRLAKCNLACSFCDTFFDAGDWLTYEEIEQKMYSLIKHGDRCGLVITGGEPLLQSVSLFPFLTRQFGFFQWVQIESNGTQLASQTTGGFDDRITLVVSPKCWEKDDMAQNYLKPPANVLERANYLKFVMRSPLHDQDPYAGVPNWAHDWRDVTGREVFISPMNIYNQLPAKAKAIRLVGAEAGVVPDLNMRSTVDEVISFWEPGLLDMESNQRNHEYAARYCLDWGFRLCLQMHLYAGLA